MPKASLGDIFDCAESAGFLIVFGHRGFAEISVHCEQFLRKHGASQIDPWQQDDPIQVGRTWIKFAPDRANGRTGVPVSAVCETFIDSIRWAAARGIKTVASNGYNAQDSHLTDIRASLLLCLGRELEAEHGVLIEFRNLRDVFVRNAGRLHGLL